MQMEVKDAILANHTYNEGQIGFDLLVQRLNLIALPESYGAAQIWTR
jgi:hypothetical protein